MRSKDQAHRERTVRGRLDSWHRLGRFFCHRVGSGSAAVESVNYSLAIT